MLACLIKTKATRQNVSYNVLDEVVQNMGVQRGTVASIQPLRNSRQPEPLS